MVFDIACVLAAIGVILLGWRRGARFTQGAGWPVAAVWIAYLILPFSTEGGSYLDMRLVPVGLMLALALQDWRTVSPRLSRIVLLTGLALFAGRLAITTHAFIGYEGANRSTLSALDRIERGARIMAFTERRCGAWRHASNSHIPSMAAHYRQAWVNSLWDVSGLHATKNTLPPLPDLLSRSVAAYLVARLPQCRTRHHRSARWPIGARGADDPAAGRLRLSLDIRSTD